MSKGDDSTTSVIRILVVDDLAKVREELAEILQLTDGLEVVGTAADGLEAIKLAEKLSPDVVLMDVEIPGLDGFDTARQIKSRQLTKAVVMLSIHSRRETRQRAKEAGVDAYVEKGEGIDRVVKTIRRVWRDHSIAYSVNDTLE